MRRNAYAFDRGVVTHADRGNCRCRINSLTVGLYCRYRESKGDDRKQCLDLRRQDGEQAWREACRDKPRAALEQPLNDALSAHVPTTSASDRGARKTGCKPDEVVAPTSRKSSASNEREACEPFGSWPPHHRELVAGAAMKLTSDVASLRRVHLDREPPA